MHERFRDVMLGAWGRGVTTRPRLTLALCLLLAVAGIGLTVRFLEFRSDRSELIDPELSWNRRYADYKSRFPRWDDLIVVLEGPAEDIRIDGLARRLAEALRADTRVLAADAGFELSEVGPRLFAVAPEERFEEVLGGLDRARTIAASANANAALASALAALSGAPPAQDDLVRLEQLLYPYLAGLEGATPDFSSLRPPPSRWLPLVSAAGSGRLRFVQVQLKEPGSGVDPISGQLAWLRGEIATLVAASDVPDLDWGVTGIPAIEADETAQSARDSTLASIVAFVLITAMMLIVFRGVVVPFLAAGALLLGLAWSFGWLILSVGHLQLLSVIFCVILMGLGIDFALHLVARLELLRDAHDDLPSVMARVFRGVGPGMLTGAVTTAAAFATTALTQFRGVAEMGIIAGGGILLCLVAVLCAFPAGLALTGRWQRVIRHRPGGETAHFAGGRLDTVDFHPRTTLALALLALLALGLPALRVRYDPNVLNLHPPGIESVEWEKRIVEDDARSVWCALIQTTAVEAPSVVDALRRRPEVSDVGAMGLLLPPDRAERLRRISLVRERSVSRLQRAADLDTLSRLLAGVRQGLLARAGEDDGSRRVAAGIGAALAAAADLTGEERGARAAALDAAFETERRLLAAWIEAALAPRAPDPDDLPPMLREQWTDGDVWLLHVYPAADPAGRSILHPDRLARFVGALAAVDPSVHGPPVQIHESSRLIKREYVKAAALAVAAILVLLLLDFHSLADALCSMLPVSIGFVGAFGLMGLFGFPLNFANIIVLPLIFGIGVDAGVHVVHRWRSEPHGRPAGLSGGTGRGITLTMLTTMIGFGCMLLAQHRGIRSLGFVMLAGLGVTLLACYLVLPAILRLRTGDWRSSAPTPTRATPGSGP